MPVWASLTLALLLASAGPAAAHSVTDRVVADAKAVVMAFTWSAGGPVAQASARLFGPGDAEPWSTLRSDAGGHLAFLPDRPGRWRVELQADPEHRIVREVQVGPDLVAAPATDWRRLLLAASLALNLGTLAALWGKHRLIALLLSQLRRTRARS